MKSEFFIWTLFQRLRRRHFPLGFDDYQALRQALQEGFGWSSHEALCELCCALWAKSLKEREILVALFNEFERPKWTLPNKNIDVSRTPRDISESLEENEHVPKESDNWPEVLQSKSDEKPTSELKTQPYKGLSPIHWDGVTLPKRSFTFVPQFPLFFREIAQTWRRLRRLIREGTPEELDVEATINQRSRLGIVSPVVLIPRRRNRVRLLLLVDRDGSMAPFHRFIEEVCFAIQKAARIEEVAVYYFHNVPTKGADESVLNSIEDQFFPTFDSILSQIEPYLEGSIYEDPEMSSAQRLVDVLETYATEADVVIFSDGGAARGNYDPSHLLNTIAFLKALRKFTLRYVWLNPLPKHPYWEDTTAAQICRHIPMFSLNREGMYQAIDVLHGKPYILEKPL